MGFLHTQDFFAAGATFQVRLGPKDEVQIPPGLQGMIEVSYVAFGENRVVHFDVLENCFVDLEDMVIRPGETSFAKYRERLLLDGYRSL